MNLLRLFILILIAYPAVCSAYLTNDAALHPKPLFGPPKTTFIYGTTPGTHQQFTEYAIDNLEYSAEVKQALKDIKPGIVSGNAKEDDEAASNALFHFYNPASYNDQGFYRLFENAKDRAVSRYRQARELYGNGSTDSAWEKLGRALHLLQDMGAPSHVYGEPHYPQTTLWLNGYEWWVARHWDGSTTDGFMLKPYLDKLTSNSNFFSRPIVAGDMAGYMDVMARQTYYGGYAQCDRAPLSAATISWGVSVVSDADAEHDAHVLIPLTIMMSGGLMQSFCKDVDCTKKSTQPQATGPVSGNPDDNYDVASRIIKLEEMEPSKSLWKELYSRTAVKKSFPNIYLSNAAASALTKLLSSASENDYVANANDLETLMELSKKSTNASFMEAYYASPDISILSDGFANESAELLLKPLQEPIREVSESFPPDMLKTQPVLVVPSAGFNGLSNSNLLKTTLAEYVKNGGTLVVFTQQHGYEFGILPTPDGNPITAYGWEEDQNCFTDGTYIDTWHQMLSGQNRSTPTVNVDGYFTSYPANATVLLRRTANGQPALIMYDYGQGRVIATTMYSDWAYGHGQTA